MNLRNLNLPVEATEPRVIKMCLEKALKIDEGLRRKISDMRASTTV